VISNATLSKIVGPRVSDGKGGETDGVETKLNAVRCMVEGPSESHERAVASKHIATAAMMYVPHASLGDVVPQEHGAVTYTLRGFASRTLAIAKVSTLIHGSLSHYQLWLYER